MAKRVQLGDVIEIPTAKGFAYAQCSHKHPRFGHLIRILPGFHQTRPASFGTFVKQKEQFVTFFPLGAAVHRGIFEIVTHEEIPEEAQAFPLFRDGVENPKTGRVNDWWLWDGQREWRVGDLTPEQRQLPIRAIWTDLLLIQRIEEGWTPSKEV